MDKITIILLRNSGPYQAGETVAVPRAVASVLLRTRDATLPNTPAPATKRTPEIVTK